MVDQRFELLPEVFSYSEAKFHGVSDHVLYSWRDQGFVEILERGVYIKAKVEADYDLVTLSVLSEFSTLCLSTALARHGLIDEIPPRIDVALPRGVRSPRTSLLVSWHHFAVDTFDIDKQKLDVGAGCSIGIYGADRCVVDAFRLSHLYGEDQAVEALRQWLRKRGNQPSKILELASQFRSAETLVRKALQYLL
jgi:hypothetical protein